MQMCHSGVDTFLISRSSTKAPDKTTTIVVDRSFPKAPPSKSAKRASCGNPTRSFHCGDFLAFTCLQVDFECFKLVPWPTWRLDFMSF